MSKRTTPEKRSALDDVSARGASHARSDERPRADVGIGSNPVGRKPCGWRFEGSEVQGATPGSGIRRRRQALRAPRPCTWRLLHFRCLLVRLPGKMICFCSPGMKRARRFRTGLFLRRLKPGSASRQINKSQVSTPFRVGQTNSCAGAETGAKPIPSDACSYDPVSGGVWPCWQFGHDISASVSWARSLVRSHGDPLEPCRLSGFRRPDHATGDRFRSAPRS